MKVIIWTSQNKISTLLHAIIININIIIIPF